MAVKDEIILVRVNTDRIIKLTPDIFPISKLNNFETYSIEMVEAVKNLNLIRKWGSIMLLELGEIIEADNYIGSLPSGWSEQNNQQKLNILISFMSSLILTIKEINNTTPFLTVTKEFDIAKNDAYTKAFESKWNLESELLRVS